MKNQILRNRIGKRLNGEAFRIMMKDTEYMKNQAVQKTSSGGVQSGYSVVCRPGGSSCADNRAL